MRNNRSRIIGAMLLVQLAGLIVPFVMLHPMTTADFLANAAAYASQIKLAAILLLANCALAVAISVLAFRFFREQSPAVSALLVAAGATMFALQAVDNAQLVSMLSLSQEYVQAGRAGEYFQPLAAAVSSGRRWVHYSELVAIDSWLFVLYGLLYSSRRVPRPLAAFGLMTVLLHFAAIPLPLFMGYSPATTLGVPMAFGILALALWLMAKGLEEGRRPLGEAAATAPREVGLAGEA